MTDSKRMVQCKYKRDNITVVIIMHNRKTYKKF